MESYIKRIRELIGDEYLIVNATAAVIVNENREILLQKRSDNELWGLPGGLLEIDESIEEALIREVKEETDLSVAIKSFIGVFSNPFMRWKKSDYAKVFAFAFEVEIKDGSLKVNDDESLEMRYFSYEELPPIHSMDTIEIIEAFYNKQYNLIEGVRYDG